MKKMEHVNESGEVMLEGLIVYTITVFLLFFLLAIFSVLFQAWNVQTIANETAARNAQIYRLESADVVTGYVTEEQLTDMPIYRYLKNRTELEMAARQKIMDYASNRLIKTTYTKATSDPQIDVEMEKDSIARRHIKVTVTGDYTVRLVRRCHILDLIVWHIMRQLLMRNVWICWIISVWWILWIIRLHWGSLAAKLWDWLTAS